MDEKYYKNPEKFDPERFSEANRINIDPDTYMPFGKIRQTLKVFWDLKYFLLLRDGATKLHWIKICFNGVKDDFLLLATNIRL